MLRPLGVLLLVAACKLPDLHSEDHDLDGYTLLEGDCKPHDPAIHPGAEDACDGYDNNCDGGVDDQLDVTGGDPFWGDVDGDGYGDEALFHTACYLHVGYAAQADDCDDDDVDVNPGVTTDACNGKDDDCDDVADEDAPNVRWRDADGDGYGDPLLAWCASTTPTLPHVGNPDDCDDTTSLSHPGAPERCEEGDNDCNGVVDDNPIDTFVVCFDGDDDGLGDPENTLDVCIDPGGEWGFDCTDCDDEVASIGAARTWYADTDLDGFGDTATTSVACDQPAGPPAWVLDPGDCALDDEDINPGEEEQCGNHTDDDCDPSDTCRWPLTRRLAGVGSPDFRVDGDVATQKIAIRLFTGDLDGDPHHETFVVRDPVIGPSEVVAVRGGTTRGNDSTTLNAVEAASFGDPPEASNEFGSALATLDDLDADDFSEVVIGDPMGNDVCVSACTPEYTGTVYVYYSDTDVVIVDPTGQKYPTQWLPNVRFQGDEADDRLGARVARVPGARGDENAFVVSAPGADGKDGAVYLVKLGQHVYDSGVSVNASIESFGFVEKWSGPANKETEFGTGLAYFRDHQGRASVAVGAKYDPDATENGHFLDGAVYIFRVPADSSAGPETVADADVVLLGYQGANGGFGTNIANVGDVDGDGVDDIAIAAPTYTTGGITHRGKVYVLTGAIPNGTAARIDSVFQYFIGAFIGPEGDADFGLSLAGGDVDGDGYSDIVFGAPRIDAGASDAGSVWVVYGRPEPFGIVTLGSSADLDGGTRFYTGLADNQFGRGLVCDDIDGDGYSDLVMGAPGFDPPSTVGQDHGAAFVMYGVGE